MKARLTQQHCFGFGFIEMYTECFSIICVNKPGNIHLLNILLFLVKRSSSSTFIRPLEGDMSETESDL